MDNDLYKALGRRAAMQNRSISQEVIVSIQRHLAAPPDQTKSADEAVLELAGSWKDDRTADEIIADIYKSRTKNTRRFKGDIF